MRKLIIIMLAVAAFFTTFVSCKADVAEEALPQGVVGVSLEIDKDKAISMWVEDAVVAYEYRAVPQFDLSEENYNEGIFGEQQTWRSIQVANYKASLGYYRQGRWVFSIRAKNRDGQVVMTGISDPVYLQKGHDNVVRVTLKMDDDRGADGRNLNTGKIAFGFETNMLDYTDLNIDKAYIRLEASKFNSTGGIDAADMDYTINLKTLTYMGAGANGFVSMLSADTNLIGKQDGRTDAAPVPGSSPNDPTPPCSDTEFIAKYMTKNPDGSNGQTAMGFMKDIVRYTVAGEEVVGLYSQMPVTYQDGTETITTPRCYVPVDKQDTITELYDFEYVYTNEVPQGRVRYYAETPDLVLGSVTTEYEGEVQTINNVWRNGISPGQYLIRVLLCVKDQNTGDEIIVAGQAIATKVVGGETTTVWGTLVPEKYISTALNIIVPANVTGTLLSDGSFQLTGNTLSSLNVTLTYSAAAGSNTTGAVYKWYVDGVLQSEATTNKFKFIPSRYGDAKITCYVYGKHADGSFGKHASATQVIQVMPATGANLN